MLQAFGITLREGLEAFLIVAISVAYLRKSGRPELVPAVRWAIGLSILVSIGGALLFQRANNQALWEGVAPGSEGWNWEERELSIPFAPSDFFLLLNVVHPTITPVLPDPAAALQAVQCRARQPSRIDALTFLSVRHGAARTTHALHIDLTFRDTARSREELAATEPLRPLSLPLVPVRADDRLPRLPQDEQGELQRARRHRSAGAGYHVAAFGNSSAAI